MTVRIEVVLARLAHLAFVLGQLRRLLDDLGAVAAALAAIPELATR